jgi:hypothetical protein
MTHFLKIGATRINLQMITRIDYFPSHSKLLTSQPHIVVSYLPGPLFNSANNHETIASDHPSFSKLMDLFQFDNKDKSSSSILKIQ